MANLPVPVPRTFTVSEVESAAFLNSIRDALNFLLNKPMAVIYQAAAQTLTNATPAALTFDSTVTDSYGGHSNSTNNTRYTAQVAGWYWIGGTASFANTAGNNRNINIYKNGTVVPQFGGAYPSATALVFPQVSALALVQLNAGDYVEIWAYQDSGGSVATHANGSSMSVMWDHA